MFFYFSQSRVRQFCDVSAPSSFDFAQEILVLVVCNRSTSPPGGNLVDGLPQDVSAVHDFVLHNFHGN